MSTQARPKFTVEEYPLVFKFPDSITTAPAFSVELLSGIDPNKDNMLGRFEVVNNKIAVFISGGVAGCIYKILCIADEVEKFSVVAVLPTDAVAPPGGGLPFTFRVNTLPYPVIYYDATSVDCVVISGTLTTLVVQSNLQDDAVSLSAEVLGGTLKYPPEGELFENLDITVSVQEGSLTTPPSGNFADDISPTVSVVEGTLGPAPTGTFIDNLDITASVLGGTLRAP